MKFIITSNSPQNEFLSKCIDIHFYKFNSKKYGLTLVFNDKLIAEGAFRFLQTWENINLLIVKRPDGNLDFAFYPEKKGIELHNFTTNHQENYITNFINETPENTPFSFFVASLDENKNIKSIQDNQDLPLSSPGYRYMLSEDAQELLARRLAR